ncbi:MAG TPA: hypothetical protein VJT73_18285 [Polyangiaceae bacterium]|nr:hypothetical protein [Polyangiaceae bacterium]
MQHRFLPSLLLALSCVVAGCADGTYVYRPAQNATANVGGLPGARYPVPAERPTGEVVIVSNGVTEIAVDESRVRVLLVRMIVTNRSDENAWSLDTRRQLVALGGQSLGPAIRVDAHQQPMPVVPVGRGERRVVDLYYRLPGGNETNDDLPRFDLAWNVQTGARSAADRTSFQRLAVEPAYASTYSDSRYGYGGGWYGGYWPYGYYGSFGYYGHYGYPGYGVHVGGGHFGGFGGGASHIGGGGAGRSYLRAR